MQSRQQRFDRMMAHNIRMIRQMSSMMFQGEDFFDIFPSREILQSQSTVNKPQQKPSRAKEKYLMRYAEQVV